MLSNVTFLLFLVTFLIFSFVQKYVILMGKHIFFTFISPFKSSEKYKHLQICLKLSYFRYTDSASGNLEQISTYFHYFSMFLLSSC